MKNKVITTLSIIFIILGSAVGAFLKIPEAQLAGFAVTMLGAGVLASRLWKESGKEKGVVSYLTLSSIALVGLGAFVAGITGAISETQLTSITGYVFGLVLIVSGLMTARLLKIDKDK